ncbi:Set5, partial [Mucuna pruriens]
MAAEEEEQLQQLRSKATELFLREEWIASIEAYSHFITLCTQTHKHRRSLCIALCNRAEARFKLKDFRCALQDCDHALDLDASHSKTLFCKGKILLCLNRYSAALHCFRTASLDGNAESVIGYLERCKSLELLSRTGCLDLSDWVLNGFRGKVPELAEHVGAVEIKKSEISGRGLFATKNIDSGSLILVTKAIAMERSIILGGVQDLCEEAQLAMWKNFVGKVSEFVGKCPRTRGLVRLLSCGENEDELEVPDVGLFRPEGEGLEKDEVEEVGDGVDMVELVSVLDVNSLTEDAVCANVLRRGNDCYGVGLWLLPSFINHSCCPNARRLHVGDYLVVHASKDLKAGEEVTFAYLDPLCGLSKRKEMSVNWGIHCKCKRCRFEGEVFGKQEVREIEIGLERGMDVGGVVYKLEEQMKRLKVRGKEKGYLRASFWGAYSEAYRSEKAMKRWGRRIPAVEVVIDSIIDVVGGDHRLLKMMVEELKKNSAGLVEREKVFKMARQVFGKVVKKQAISTLLELCIGFVRISRRYYRKMKIISDIHRDEYKGQNTR